jgi:hypothetical protein
MHSHGMRFLEVHSGLVKVLWPSMWCCTTYTVNEHEAEGENIRLKLTGLVTRPPEGQRPVPHT